MIYEETYHYLLRNVSSTEFDTCLYSLLHSDWDGVIQSPLHMMASGVGTTEKYLKQIIKKFTSPQGCLQKVFVPVGQDGDVLYKFNLGPTSNLGFNSKTDRYCKKYRFFYSEAFKNLTIHAKRLLLMGAFRMSVTKSEEVLFDYSEIVPDSSSLFTRQRLLDAIDTVHKTLGNLVTISFASKAFSKKRLLCLPSMKECWSSIWKIGQNEHFYAERFLTRAFLDISVIPYVWNWNESADTFSVRFFKMRKNQAFLWIYNMNC